MAKIKPNGDFKVKQELHTSAVFPAKYTVSDAEREIRAEKANGQFIVYFVNGGIRKMEFLEREKVNVQESA